MGMYDVITYGGGANYRDIFIAVALMTGTGAMASLIRVGLLLGLVFGLVKGMVDLNPGRILKWFLVAAVIYLGLFIPKVTVHIVDKYNPALAGADVANVPIGVAVTEALASQIGSHAIDMAETAFGDPTDLEYSQTGMIYGAKLMEAATKLHFSDQTFAQNLDSFIQNCVYYDLNDGYYKVDDLAKSTDLWTFWTSTHPPNPARSMPFTDPNSGATSVVTCPQGATNLSGTAMSNATISAAATMEGNLIPGTPAAQAWSDVNSHFSALAAKVGLASANAQSQLQQLAIVNELKSNLEGASGTGSGATSALAEAQAQLQTSNTGNLLGKVGQNAIVVLKIVIDALFIGIFPVLFPCFLLPQIGPKMLLGYVTGFFYLQLWGPMYVIVHRIILSAEYAQAQAAATIAGGPGTGFSLQTVDAVNSVSANIESVAGMMIMMIPVIAGALTKGAMAVGSQGEALLQPFRAGAESAAGTQTTGNWSYGNTSVDTHAFNNRTENQILTSPRVDKDRFSYVSGNNVEETYNRRSGALVGVRGSPADSAITPERMQEASIQEGQRARAAAERVQSFERARQLAQAETHQRVHEMLTASSTGSERRVGVSNDSSDRTSTADGYFSSVVDAIAHRANVSRQYAARALEQESFGWTASADARLGLGVGGKGQGGSAGVGIGQNLSANSSTVRSGETTAQHQRAQDLARTVTQSADWKKQIERLDTESLNKSFATVSGTTNSTSNKSAHMFSSTSSFNEAWRNARSEQLSAERSAERLERTSNLLRSNYSAQFLAFLAGSEGKPGYLSVDAYGHRRDVGEIMQGRTAADRELLMSGAEAFTDLYMPKLKDPEFLTQTQSRTGGPPSPDGFSTLTEDTPSRGGHRAGARPSHGMSAPSDQETVARRGAAEMGLTAPSSERELSPDATMRAVGENTNREVDAALDAPVKDVTKKR